ncbi:MAG: tetratricopeptide repeat protein [Bacteroidota bacterium]|nr:tetratricopeptide repeat protein [Bacteroidota bacterium]
MSVVILLVGFISISAQKNNAIDSLKTLYNNSKSDSAKIKTLLSIYYAYSHINIDSSRVYAMKIYHVANKTSNNKNLGISNHILGISYMAVGESKKNINHQFIALKYAELSKDTVLIVKIYNSIANCYASQKKIDFALMYYEKAFELAKIINSEKISVILMNMGNIYYEKGYYTDDFSKAYTYYLESLKYAKQERNVDQISTVLSNLSLVYCDDKKFNEALKCLNESLRLTDSLNLVENKIEIYYSIGRVKAGLKSYDEALVNYNKSLSYAFKMKNKDFISDNYLSMADVYAEKGEYKSAYELYKKYKATEDSLVNVASINELNELQTKYESAKKQKENELLTTQNKLSTQKIKQQKIISYFIISALILALGLAYFIFRGLKNQRMANRIISKQKQEVERQKQLVEEHQKEILDSIHYAKRIQQSLLPTKKYLDKTIKRLNE